MSHRPWKWLERGTCLFVGEQKMCKVAIRAECVGHFIFTIANWINYASVDDLPASISTLCFCSWLLTSFLVISTSGSDPRMMLTAFRGGTMARFRSWTRYLCLSSSLRAYGWAERSLLLKCPLSTRSGHRMIITDRLFRKRASFEPSILLSWLVDKPTTYQLIRFGIKRSLSFFQYISLTSTALSHFSSTHLTVGSWSPNSAFTIHQDGEVDSSTHWPQAVFG